MNQGGPKSATCCSMKKKYSKNFRIWNLKPFCTENHWSEGRKIPCRVTGFCGGGSLPSSLIIDFNFAINTQFLLLTESQSWLKDCRNHCFLTHKLHLIHANFNESKCRQFQKGLSYDQASRLRLKYGFNELRKKNKGLIKIALEGCQGTNVFIVDKLRIPYFLWVINWKNGDVEHCFFNYCHFILSELPKWKKPWKRSKNGLPKGQCIEGQPMA